MNPWMRQAALAVMLLGAARAAAAEAGDSWRDHWSQRQEPRRSALDSAGNLTRTAGAGVGVGGGCGLASVLGLPSGSAGGALLLPALELRFFLASGHSIDLSVPIVNSVLASVLLGGFTVGLDGFYNFNAGTEGVRFLVGPGLGASVLVAGGAAIFALKVPVVLGVEFLTEGRGFGFSVQARPHFDLALGSFYGGSAVTAGAGVLGVLAFNWYGTEL